MARLPDIESEQSKLTTVLRAMSNAKRLRILNELADGRERSVSELEGVIASLSQSALSQHLARLRRANIVRTRRESQTIFTRLMMPTFFASSDSLAISTMTTRSCSAPNIRRGQHGPTRWRETAARTDRIGDLLRPRDIPRRMFGGGLIGIGIVFTLQYS